MSLEQDLVAAIKRRLRARGLTYGRLAPQLGLSEAAVKRMFSRGSLTLARVEQICTLLELGLPELAEEAQARRPALAELDAAAEQALVEDPALLLALFVCLNRWTQDEVLLRFRFTVPEWTLLLARLDRLGVLEMQPGNKVRLRTARNFRWRRDGPMQRFFQQQLLPEYFHGDFTGPGESLLLLTGMMSPPAAEEMRRRLDEVAGEFDRLMARDAALPVTDRVGVSLVLLQRPWMLRLFAPLQRTQPDPSG
jgi:DNA-binding Xre family transcriptional regulator